MGGNEFAGNREQGARSREGRAPESLAAKRRKTRRIGRWVIPGSIEDEDEDEDDDEDDRLNPEP